MHVGRLKKLAVEVLNSPYFENTISGGNAAANQALTTLICNHPVMTINATTTQLSTPKMLLKSQVSARDVDLSLQEDDAVLRKLKRVPDFSGVNVKLLVKSGRSSEQMDSI